MTQSDKQQLEMLKAVWNAGQFDGGLDELAEKIWGMGYNAAIEAAAQVTHDLAYDGDMIHAAALACEKAIRELKK